MYPSRYVRTLTTSFVGRVVLRGKSDDSLKNVLRFKECLFAYFESLLAGIFVVDEEKSSFMFERGITRVGNTGQWRESEHKHGDF